MWDGYRSPEQGSSSMSTVTRVECKKEEIAGVPILDFASVLVYDINLHSITCRF